MHSEACVYRQVVFAVGRLFRRRRTGACQVGCPSWCRQARCCRGAVFQAPVWKESEWSRECDPPRRIDFSNPPNGSSFSRKALWRRRASLRTISTAAGGWMHESPVLTPLDQRPAERRGLIVRLESAAESSGGQTTQTRFFRLSTNLLSSARHVSTFTLPRIPPRTPRRVSRTPGTHSQSATVAPRLRRRTK